MDSIDMLKICIPEMAMRKTTVQIDKSLLEEAIKAIGAKTQKEAIEAGLKYLVQRKNMAFLLFGFHNCNFGSPSQPILRSYVSFRSLPAPPVSASHDEPISPG